MATVEENIAVINRTVEFILADVEEMNELGMAVDAEAFAVIQGKVDKIDARVATLEFRFAKQIIGSVEKLKLALATLKIKPAKTQA